ncbi:Dynein beta chain, ciliary [Eufriesea mexicana]|nr:Dynein beta chain, ciliary [Eufriesea mexicana]
MVALEAAKTCFAVFIEISSVIDTKLFIRTKTVTGDVSWMPPIGDGSTQRTVHDRRHWAAVVPKGLNNNGLSSASGYPFPTISESGSKWELSLDRRLKEDDTEKFGIGVSNGAMRMKRALLSPSGRQGPPLKKEKTPSTQRSRVEGIPPSGVGHAAWKNPALTVEGSSDKLDLPLREAAHLAVAPGCLAARSLVTSGGHVEAELPAFARSQQDGVCRYTCTVPAQTQPSSGPPATGEVFVNLGDTVPIVITGIPKRDLFPVLEVPRKRDLDFEATVRQSTLDLKLQPEDGFILKVYVFGNCETENSGTSHFVWVRSSSVKARSEDKRLPKGGETPSDIKGERDSSLRVSLSEGSPSRGVVTTALSPSVYAGESRGCARPPHVPWPRRPTAHLAARS